MEQLPVERQVTTTTTGAWEEIIFDFSAEGAVEYTTAVIFMNFNVVDGATQTYYWDNLELFTAKLNKNEANEAFSKAVQALGFDGIIQKESASKGGQMTNTYGIFKNKYSTLS